MENLIPWFKLKSVPGIGNHLFKRLIDNFKSPAKVFEASRDEMLQVEGFTPRLVSLIKGHKTSDIIKKELDFLSHSNYKIITMNDKDYPFLLLQIPDPPPFLYVFGSLENRINNIALVGSRKATSYGIITAKRLGMELASRSITVVSGMAKGIDTAAHVGAIEGKGRTVAVLGSGLDRIYPAENRKLFNIISENGAVISEFPLTAEPEARNFPIRNRIISGLCLGTVVVEAASRSGSLITARLAAEQNREVFAVPGSINSFASVGSHALIKQGARLIENVEDIFEELQILIDTSYDKTESRTSSPYKVPADKIPDMSHDEKKVLKSLGPYPFHIDDLLRKLSMEPGELSGILLKLEIKGMVKQTPGNFFSIDDKFSFLSEGTH